ncbi:MAG: T9SS type A sorting domain-containing protein [Ignavibacteriae bacterium]|nr:T9SS type A sorting domain-containing protein [Ignavibacteriota bacterium]
MKKLIYALLAIAILYNFTYAEKKVMITTRDGMMKQYTASMAKEISKPFVINNYGKSNIDIRPLVKKGGLDLILAEQDVFIRTLSDTSDSVFIYPPNANTQQPGWVFTGWYDFPNFLGPEYGTSTGFGQFVAPLQQKFRLDSIYLPIFKINAWPDVKSDFALLLVSVKNEQMGQQNWPGFYFEANDDNKFDLLVNDYIFLNKDTINTRLKDNGGQFVLDWYKLILNDPIEIPAGSNFGYFIQPTNTNLTDTVRFLGGFEWGLPKEQTYGVHVRKNNNNDTVESIFKWHRYWEPPNDQTFRPLNNVKIRQNFDCIFWGSIETAVIEHKGDAAPLNLEQNYPNPVSGITNIKFSIENSNFVNLDIYNSMGQKVTQLVNKMMDAGTYNVSFDSEELTQGTYFYTLRSGNRTITKAMNIVK